MKNILYLGISLLLAMLVVSCGGGSGEGADGGVKVSASQIEEAHVAGREAAREFVRREWKDTMQLQELLIEASAKAAKFDSITRLRAAYDSAFISTVRTVNPGIAAELERYQREMKK